MFSVPHCFSMTFPLHIRKFFNVSVVYGWICKDIAPCIPERNAHFSHFGTLNFSGVFLMNQRYSFLLQQPKNSRGTIIYWTLVEFINREGSVDCVAVAWQLPQRQLVASVSHNGVRVFLPYSICKIEAIGLSRGGFSARPENQTIIKLTHTITK